MRLIQHEDARVLPEDQKQGDSESKIRPISAPVHGGSSPSYSLRFGYPYSLRLAMVHSFGYPISEEPNENQMKRAPREEKLPPPHPSRHVFRR